MNWSDLLLGQAVALPFALLVALLAAIHEAGYGHRLNRLYDLASKAPDGAAKEYFEKQAEQAATLLMERNVRWAKNWLWLVFVFIFYFLLVPTVTAAIVSGVWQGYAQAVGRDASLMEVAVVATAQLALLFITIGSLVIVLRHYARNLSQRWREDKIMVILVLLIGLIVLALLVLVRYGLTQVG